MSHEGPRSRQVLLEQIDSLRQTIDRQGEMLDRLARIMLREEGGAGKKRQSQEEQFALGDDE